MKPLRPRTLFCAGLFVALDLVAAGAWLAGCGDEAVSPTPLGDAGAGGASDAGDAGDAFDGNTCGLIDASALDPAAVAYGLVLIQSHKCFSCHGDTLSGNDDGVTYAADEGGTAYPPNLTPDFVTGLGCWTTPQIVRAILDGIDNMEQPICPPMPQFSDAGALTLTPVEALAVAEYLESLPAIVNNVPNTNCPAGPPPPDAGCSDAATADAATADAGSMDAGSADAGSIDAGSADAGSIDAGSADAGSIDAGSADAADDGDSGLADDAGDAAGE